MEFEVNSIESATWAFKQISKLEADSKIKTEVANKEIEEAQERIDKNKEWIEKETKSNNDSIEYFKSLLVAYYRQLRAENPKAKLTTPYGKITSRKAQPTWTFDDEKTISFLRLNAPNLLQEKITYNKTEVKKLFNLIETGTSIKAVDENGEVIDFANIQPQDDSYSVKTN